MATVRKRGKSYQIRASAGYGADGQQIVKAMTWTPPEGMTSKQIEKELNRISVDFERRVESGQCIEGNIKFSEFAEKWMADYAQPNLAPATVAGYVILLKRINEAIGNIRLDKLQPAHLIEFYRNLAETGIREDTKYYTRIDLAKLLKLREITQRQLSSTTGLAVNTIAQAIHGENISGNTAKELSKALNLKLNDTFISTGKEKLSGNTLSHYHRLISSILSIAVSWQIISSNPALRVKAPKIGHTESAYLDENSAAHMIELLENEPRQYKTAIVLLLYSGMRRGELCGLKWSDFDFENHLVTIVRSSQYLPGKGIFLKETKTNGSMRTIKLPGITFTLLREYRI